jgi:hypothetical protein
MPDPIKVGNVTIHQVVEQEGPFFDMLPFFPTGALGEKQVHIVFMNCRESSRPQTHQRIAASGVRALRPSGAIFQ